MPSQLDLFVCQFIYSYIILRSGSKINRLLKGFYAIFGSCGDLREAGKDIRKAGEDKDSRGALERNESGRAGTGCPLAERLRVPRVECAGNWRCKPADDKSDSKGVRGSGGIRAKKIQADRGFGAFR